MNKQNGGNKSGHPKLNREQVDVIRKKYAEDMASTTVSIGKEYGVTQSCIYKIVHNHTWRDENYIPPEIKLIRVRRESKDARLPALDCPYQCHVCGMGYEDKGEANTCCESRREWSNKDGYTGTGISKWDESCGRDPHYRYKVHHDWAFRR